MIKLNKQVLLNLNLYKNIVIHLEILEKSKNKIVVRKEHNKWMNYF